MGYQNARRTTLQMSSRTSRCLLLVLAGLGGACLSCTQPSRNAVQPASSVAATVSNGGRATVRYAKGFVLEYHEGYKKLSVLSPWRGAKAGFTYVLVPRDGAMPKLNGSEMVIRTPVRRFVVTSTIYVPYLSMLGLDDTLVGVAKGHMISTPSTAERFAAGKIAEVSDGSGGMMRRLNMERLLSLQPDLVMLYGTGNPTYDFHEQLHAAGIPFAINAEYMESTPLGATEWIKFIAAFFDKDAEAERIFADIASRYEAQAAEARAASTHPTTFSGMDYHGVWYMPGGGSYRAKLFADAGASYLWADDKTQGSMPLTMEAVMLRARQADFWVDVGECGSLQQLAGFDNRYRLVRAFQNHHVYNNDARMGPGGGNDFWETGMANPDRVLADLISIFHPELKPGHKRVWYRQLPEQGAR
jgi:iron complex transport system substrate-binding protein